MSSKAPTASPASPSAPHGGDMDPNAVRVRLARLEHTSASRSYSAESPSVPAAMNPPHGGDMDPNEIRLRQARVQQNSGSSSPAGNSLSPNNAIVSRGMVQTPQAQIQPTQTQYGSGSHLINGAASPSSGYNSYQTPQSPQSMPSGQYFPTQYGNQPSYPNQAQQPHQNPHSGLPNQVDYC